MLQPNPEIQAVINNATELAINKQHEYVTLEHLLLAMVTTDPFSKFLDSFGVDLDAMTDEIHQYLDEQTYLASSTFDGVPKKTHSLERTFNRAFTQVLFNGGEFMRSIDLFISLMLEDKSRARYYILKYGIDRAKLVEHWNKQHAGANKGKRSGNKSVADKVLAEYCTNLTELAGEGEIDPVIGRQQEIDEITQVLAKRNKSNILLVGDPGVGKTAIAEGLALNIIEENVPDYLKDHTVYSLDIGTLLAGSKYRGEFEEKNS